MDVVVDLALHSHDEHAADRAVYGGEPAWSVRVLDVGHRLLDCARACPGAGRARTSLPHRLDRMHTGMVPNHMPVTCMTGSGVGARW